MIPASADKNFRHDINALRAIAVVVVLLFHFRVPGFAGGFAGVDVFFVISGYLMTSIIVNGLRTHNFSLWRFYVARARRILPALGALVAVLLFIGWWVLPQSDYRDLASNSLYALVFISNIRFQRDAGYFEAASHDNWLLHTWSLAVEWQFYLLLPVFIMLVWRFRQGQRHLLLIVIIGLLVSLARSVWLAYNNPDAAFFLLQSRAWQMLAGAAAFLLTQQPGFQSWQGNRRLATASVILGLMLIAITVVKVDATTTWPGLAALAPVLGTALVLMAAKQSAWTRLAPVQYLGLSSYSIYLWHWPVFAALIFLGIASHPFAVVSGLVLSVALGTVSLTLIENPVRRVLDPKPGYRTPALILSGFFIVVTSATLIYLQQGVAGRLPPAAERAAAEALNVDDRRDECLVRGSADFPWCQFGGADIQAVVVGDSHASSLFTVVAEAVQRSESDQYNQQAGIYASSFNGCATLLRGSSRDDAAGCRAFNRFLVERLQSVPGDVPLIIANRNSIYHLGGNIRGDDDFERPLVFYGQPQSQPDAQLTQQYTQDLIETACHFAEQRTVFLLRPIPEMLVDVPRSMARRLLLNRSGEIRIARTAYQQRHAAVWQAQDEAAGQCGVRILDPTQYLCDSDYCYGTQNGRPLYYDEDHLSEFGNRKLLPLFLDT